MKTLYININSEKIESSDNIDVLEYDLINDFYFALGEKLLAVYPIAGIDKIKLFTDYMDSCDVTGADSILEQWSQLKMQLFGESHQGSFTVYLPDSYLNWLKYNVNQDYCRLAEKISPCIHIDIEEFYEDSIDGLKRRILRYLHKEDRCKDIDEFVFNDYAVARKSAIVRAIKEKYEDIGFMSYEKWLCDNEEMLHTHPQYSDKSSTDSDCNSGIEEEVFAVACDQSESDDKKWFAEFYTKNGTVLQGKYELIAQRFNFFYLNGNYYFIKEDALSKISLKECSGATVVDEENAVNVYGEYLILECKRGVFVVNNEGKMTVPVGCYDAIKYAHYDCVLAEKKGLWGVVSLNNDVLIDFQYERISPMGYRCYSIEGDDGKVGVIDENGNTVIAPEYDEIILLSGWRDSLWFKVSQGCGYYGVVDADGNLIIPMVYDEIEMLYDNNNEDRLNYLSPFFIVREREESGLIDSEGEIVIPFDVYESIEFDILSHNYIFASYEDDYDYLESRWINPPFVYEIPDKFCVYDKNGLRLCLERPFQCVLKEKQAHYLINKSGLVVYSSYCDDLWQPDEDSEWYREDNEDRQTIIGANGNILFDVPRGFNCYSGAYGTMVLCYSATSDENLIVNQKGKILKIIPKSSLIFKDGKLFFIESDGSVGYYDESLTRILTCNCQDVESIIDVMHEGVMSVRTKSGNWGLLNYQTGKLLEYEGLERIDCLHSCWIKGGHKAMIANYFLLRRDGKNTLIDKDGNYIIDKEYRLIDGI